MVWVMMVFLHGTEIQENVYFNDLDTCLEYAERVRAQDYHQRVEARINDLITKLENKEIKLTDLSEEDKNVIMNILNQND